MHTDRWTGKKASTLNKLFFHANSKGKQSCHVARFRHKPAFHCFSSLTEIRVQNSLISDDLNNLSGPLKSVTCSCFKLR